MHTTAQNMKGVLNTGINRAIQFNIGNSVLTIIIIPNHSCFIIYDNQISRIIGIITVCPCAGGFTTKIFISEALVYDQVKTRNILEPMELDSLHNGNGRFMIESEIPSKSLGGYLHEWWDGLYYVIGPSWQIKYPHPNREFYHIASFNAWIGYGMKLIHHQIDSDMSAVLANLGWAALFAAIGTLIGEEVGGPYGAAAGAVIGTVLGILFGYATQAILSDEEGCIWWWSSKDFENWLSDNA